MIAALIGSGAFCVIAYLCFGQMLDLYITNIGKFTYKRQKRLNLAVQFLFFLSVAACVLADSATAAAALFGCQTVAWIVYCVTLRYFCKRRCYKDISRYLAEIDVFSLIAYADDVNEKFNAVQELIKSRFGMYYHIDVIKEVAVTLQPNKSA